MINTREAGLYTVDSSHHEIAYETLDKVGKEGVTEMVYYRKQGIKESLNRGQE